MKIVMSRVDERLVHGQVIASWTKILAVKYIMVVDDQLAQDSFMSTVLSMAAPSGVKVELMDVPTAVKKLQAEPADNGLNTMLLFKTPKYALEMLKQGITLKELNVGNMGAGPGRKALSRNVYASPEEIEIFQQLLAAGVDVYLQMVQQESRASIETKL